MVWVVTVVLLFYSCSMHHFFPILRVPKDPQATPWEPTAWKDKVENLCLGVHLFELPGSTAVPGGGKSRTLGSLQKELSCSENEGFSWNKSRQVWSCCAVSSPCSQGRVSLAANAPCALQGKDFAASRLDQPSQQEQSYRLAHHFLGMGGNKVQGCSIGEVTFPLTFFFQKNGFIEGKKGVVETILLGTKHPIPSGKGWFSAHSVSTVPCYPCTSHEKVDPWTTVFGEVEWHGDHTAEECRYLGLLWKDPVARSPGCTVLSISLPPPGFGREQIPSRIIGLRSWKVIQILH